jgi:hypothetical protein
MRESQAATKRGADMASFAEEETPSELGAPKAPTELDLATQRGADVAAWAEEESVARAEGDEQDWERLLATNELKEAAAAVLKARAADSDCESFVSISNDGRVKDGVWAAVRSPPIPTHREPFSNSLLTGPPLELRDHGVSEPASRNEWDGEVAAVTQNEALGLRQTQKLTELLAHSPPPPLPPPRPTSLSRSCAAPWPSWR